MSGRFHMHFCRCCYCCVVALTECSGIMQCHSFRFRIYFSCSTAGHIQNFRGTFSKCYVYNQMFKRHMHIVFVLCNDFHCILCFNLLCSAMQMRYGHGESFISRFILTMSENKNEPTKHLMISIWLCVVVCHFHIFFYRTLKFILASTSKIIQDLNPFSFFYSSYLIIPFFFSRTYYKAIELGSICSLSTGELTQTLSYQTRRKLRSFFLLQF